MRLLAALSLAGCLHAASTSEHFEQKVRPVFAKRCYACHTATKTAGLRLDSRAAILAGGKSGPAIIPGDAEKSLLIQAIRQHKMPPGSPLDPSEIESIETWVRDGAPWTDAPSSKPGALWSAGPLRKPSATSIDQAVEKALQAKGLTPNAKAGKRALLRRLNFDLVGLPPTPEEMDAFLADTSPRALETVADRLLASPHFGERWARHWLDVARFGEDDFTGTAVKPYPNAWRYRDWVVDAFNQDMPYDKFLQAQIAGDQMEDPHRQYLGGLGLFGVGPWYFGISQPSQARADERHDRIDVVTRGMLGLTVACARCHDHKYDPIPTKDYYALSGVFASVQYKEYPLASADEVAKWTATNKEVESLEAKINKFLDQQSDQLAEIFSSRVADYMVAAWRKIRGTKVDGYDEEMLDRWVGYLKKPEDNHPYLQQWRNADSGDDEAEVLRQSLLVESQINAIVAEKKKLDEENREIVAKNKKPKPGRDYLLPFGYRSESDFNPGAEIPTKSLERDKYVWYNWLFSGEKAILRPPRDKVERFLAGEWKKHLDGLRASLKAKKESLPPQYAYLHGIEDFQPIDMGVNLRGNPDELGEPVPRGFLTALSDGPRQVFIQGSGRLELARTISAHPLARRVMANRIWLYLFGSGVVRTPSNFGVMGERPANPELLEYLAWRFDQNGLSVKQLIREIVLSKTYQSSTDSNAANEAKDPGNRFFWRANRKRLDAEALRDAILMTSGSLDPKVGGESQPLIDSKRRTIYARLGRFEQDATMALFDFPNASVSNEQRVVTNVPLQKLFFLNSAFVLDQAKTFAALLRPLESPTAQIQKAYQRAYGRPPSDKELTLAKQFLDSAGPRALEQYAQVLLGSNEFAFVD